MDTDNVSKALDKFVSFYFVIGAQLKAVSEISIILYPGQRHSKEQNGKSLELLEDRFHLLWSGSGRCDIIISS